MLPAYLTEFHQLPEVPEKTLQRMMQTCLQQYQVSPVPTPMLERLPLATPVKLVNSDTLAVICDHNPTDSRRYRITWFDRRLWQVRSRWVSRRDFDVVEGKQTAEAAAGSAVA